RRIKPPSPSYHTTLSCPPPLPPPPTSPLFPYTTLFRSFIVDPPDLAYVFDDAQLASRISHPDRQPIFIELHLHPLLNIECPKKIDRKSTRLNSSHSQISYAVFCLKKKKTIDKNVDTYRH